MQINRRAVIIKYVKKFTNKSKLSDKVFKNYDYTLV